MITLGRSSEVPLQVSPHNASHLFYNAPLSHADTPSLEGNSSGPNGATDRSRPRDGSQQQLQDKGLTPARRSSAFKQNSVAQFLSPPRSIAFQNVKPLFAHRNRLNRQNTFHGKPSRGLQ